MDSVERASRLEANMDMQEGQGPRSGERRQKQKGYPQVPPDHQVASGKLSWLTCTSGNITWDLTWRRLCGTSRP